MQRVAFELGVYVHGRPIREYLHKGLTYVEGRKGSEFTLRVRNHSGDRVLAVVSVDGLSIINGQAAGYDSGGYVLMPFSEIKIPGWSLSLETVAKFYFAQFDKSYAAKMAQPQNVGVIAAALFKEVQSLATTITYCPGSTTYEPIRWYSNISATPNWTNGVYNTSSCDVSCNYSQSSDQVHVSDQDSAPSASCFFNHAEIGTGFGDATSFKVQNTIFSRESLPCATLEVYYDTREGLLRKGVDIRRKPQVAVPNPFPAQFCRPPADRRK